MKLLKRKDKFLYFVILAFIFVASTALAATGSLTEVINSLPLSTETKKVYPAIPILSSDVKYPIFSAQGIKAVDLDSGISLYEKNPDDLLFPASTTKIVTALVALDYYSLDSVVTIPKGVAVDGQKMGLFPGEQMRVEDLLYGLLVYSANDAAEAFAMDYPGGYDAFISAMNQKAKELSMNSSHFDNPVGLDGNTQRSTARDLVRASEVAMRNPEFSKIVGTEKITIKDVSGKYSYNLRNINQLLGKVPGVMGVKTGWTENARENLVTYVVRDGHKIMIALLGSADRFGETEELINWILTSYKWEKVDPTVRNM